MNWFNRIVANRYVEAVLVADDQGRILRSSRPLRSDDELVASMLQSAEVLAQTLAEELWSGPAEMVHLSTDSEHLLLFPLAASRYYAVIIIPRTAPVHLVLIELKRALAGVDAGELHELARKPELDPAPTGEVTDPEAQELITAVEEWLRHQRTSGGDLYTGFDGL